LAEFRRKSQVLHGSTSIWNKEHFGMSSRGGLLALLDEYQERLSRALELLDQVPLAFENQKLQARRGGKQEPGEMPPELLAEKHKLEARADVILEEIARIKELISEFETRAKREKEAMVLKFGPMGTSKGSPCTIIDGQPCGIDAEGLPRIDCPKSPFNGMRVCDYREKIVKPWRTAINEAYQAAYAKANDLEATDGARLAATEKAAMILRNPSEHVPWPEKPKE